MINSGHIFAFFLSAIPELPRPIGPSDTAINLAINALQKKGKGMLLYI